jgi:DNA helicase-2/ATP-dependent DNA helicase PcrA
MLKERTIMSNISRAKDEYISPEQFLADAGNDYNLKRIAQVYVEYQKDLKLNNALDFDDLIFKTVELFEKAPDVLESYQERFRYIMVDEYQDTNTIQFRLISLLAHKYGNLCVVGDDDQSIYKFRGANISNILNFETVFRDAKVIKLEQNYRSTQTILNAANSVIANNVGRKAKTLWTDNSKGDKIPFNIYEDGYREAEGVVNSICEKVRDGWNYNDFAILYRTNAQSRLLEEK